MPKMVLCTKSYDMVEKFTKIINWERECEGNGYGIWDMETKSSTCVCKNHAMGYEDKRGREMGLF